jgi:hypothetical protein
MTKMTQDDRIQQIGDNVALLLERSNQHAAQLSALFAKMDTRHAGGCALHSDIVRRIGVLEERPTKTLAAASTIAAIISGIIAGLAWVIRGGHPQ